MEFAFFAVCRITTTSIDLESGNNGTGFLVATDFVTPKAKLLVITNKHLIPHPNLHVNISLNQRDASGKALLGKQASLNLKYFVEIYQSHEDYDLALIDITSIEWDMAPFNKFLDDSEPFLDSSQLWPGMNVFYIGFPDGRFDESNNLPLVRSGFIASYPSLDYNDKPQFLIDTHSFEGSSGSPVLIYFSGRMMLLGIYTEVMQSKMSTEPGKGLPIDYRVPLGLAIVLKAKVITELINQYKGRILLQ